MAAIAIIQARMGSSRLPGKVLKEIDGTPLIGLLIERLKKAKSIDDIVVATTDQPVDDQLVDFLESINVNIFRGSEQDVLATVFHIALQIAFFLSSALAIMISFLATAMRTSL